MAHLASVCLAARSFEPVAAPFPCRVGALVSFDHGCAHLALVLLFVFGRYNVASNNM